jgi:hypothetical protein
VDVGRRMDRPACSLRSVGRAPDLHFFACVNFDGLMDGSCTNKIWGVFMFMSLGGVSELSVEEDMREDLRI